MTSSEVDYNFNKEEIDLFSKVLVTNTNISQKQQKQDKKVNQLDIAKKAKLFDKILVAFTFLEIINIFS